MNWKNWRGCKSWPAPSMAECLASCLANADEAARMERRVRQLYNTTPPGSKECARAFEDVCRWSSDKHHWTQMAQWYQQRVGDGQQMGK